MRVQNRPIRASSRDLNTQLPETFKMQLTKTRTSQFQVNVAQFFAQRVGRYLSIVWREVVQLTLLTIGAVTASLAYSIFQIPFDIAAGGVSGIGIIVNAFTGWSEAAIYFVLNIPLLILGFFYLGRWTFLTRTLLAVAIFTVATEFFVTHLPSYLETYPVTDDVFLSAVYAGVVGGIGGGLIFRASATMGGTGVIGRIIQMKTGIPLSQVYLYTDGVIVLTAAFVFGWEVALYAMLTLLLSGMASDYVLEGASRARTATIVTDEADAMVQALIARLGRGVSHWEVVGGYSGEARSMIMCTIYRPQLQDLLHVVNEVDPKAFVSIGVTQQAMGEGFTRRATA